MSRPLLAIAGVALLLGATPAGAEPTAPTAYAIVETTSLVAQGQTIKIYRDGDRAMMEQYAPKQADGNTPPHTRTYYDLKAGRSYTLDLDDPLVPCGVADFKSDWGDPFGGAAEMSAALAKQKTIDGGTATLHGVATKIVQAATPQGDTKMWIEPKSSLLMKWQIMAPKGEAMTVLEVTAFSTAAPAATLLDIPASCRKTSPSQPDQTVHLMAGPGGGENGIANAIMPPASSESCTALLRIVRLGSMMPLAGGYQVAVDRAVDSAHPASYSVGLSADGRASFVGGALRDETGAVKDGILRIANMPKQIHVEACFGKGGCASALIYRHCTAPESTLVLSVHNLARLSEGADWYWIKAPPR